jgi:hypothetical protein
MQEEPQSHDGTKKHKGNNNRLALLRRNFAKAQPVDQ